MTKQNDKVQKEISEARAQLERKLAEGELIWKDARKYLRYRVRKMDSIKMQSTANFGKDLIKFMSSLAALESLKTPETAPDLVVGADMTRKILLKALDKNGVRVLDPLHEKFNP